MPSLYLSFASLLIYLLKCQYCSMYEMFSPTIPCLIIFVSSVLFVASFNHLSNPLIITTTTNKNQRQSIIPHITRITLKKHSFIMPTLSTMSLLTTGEGWIIADCGWDGV
mmetsp:Transcript_1505/g.2663  ORF Transcript_1505/g.2663 Transcript_1505/m.2663 type:complete len:110 (-) Transcript_1505:399-728(-)